MKNNNQAFVIITSVLIMAAGIWVVLVGQAGLHLNESLANQSWRKSNELSFVTDGCLDVAYRGLEIDRFYPGQSLSVGGNSCIINVVRNGGNYQIIVTARSGEYYKKIQAGANLNAGSLTVNSWQELER